MKQEQKQEKDRQMPYYTKSKTPFEDYLKEIHADGYIGSDDDMSDDFEGWVTELQVDDLIDYGNKFAKLLLTVKNV